MQHNVSLRNYFFKHSNYIFFKLRKHQKFDFSSYSSWLSYIDIFTVTVFENGLCISKFSNSGKISVNWWIASSSSATSPCSQVSHLCPTTTYSASLYYLWFICWLHFKTVINNIWIIFWFALLFFPALLNYCQL